MKGVHILKASFLAFSVIEQYENCDSGIDLSCRKTKSSGSQVRSCTQKEVVMMMIQPSGSDSEMAEKHGNIECEWQQ